MWFVPFDRWWNEVVISIPERFDLTRKDLVLTMANQDGGVHVDPSISEPYYELTREKAMGITMGDGTVDDCIESASVRQIAEETLRSIGECSETIPPDIVWKHNVLCPCKSGLRYTECHAAGGRNAGT